MPGPEQLEEELRSWSSPEELGGEAQRVDRVDGALDGEKRGAAGPEPSRSTAELGTREDHGGTKSLASSARARFALRQHPRNGA
jgi:hypothetical protein